MEAGANPRVREAARLSPVQRITIGNLRRGQKEAVPVTLFADADADGLLAAHERHGVTVTAVLALLLARTLSDEPALNAAVVEDKLVRYADVNLGIAVALDDGGLVVPVLPRAHERTLADVATAVASLAARARAGSLELADVRPGRDPAGRRRGGAPGGARRRRRAGPPAAALAHLRPRGRRGRAGDGVPGRADRADRARGSVAPVSRHEIPLPRFADGMTEAFVAEWYTEPGATIAAGEPLVELITDKVNMVMDAPVGGRVVELRFEAEERVGVGEVLAVVEVA
jgi:pyruvate/2-oxoglutarate dehydrogenase complex dihydrolipoamide acyltransferase (E2) component